MSSLIVAEVSLELVAALGPLERLIRARNKSLADQLSRAAESVALNTGEAEYSDPGNKRARFHSAAGSANETRVAVRIAMARGYFGAAQAAEVLRLLDRIIAMLWRLTHPR